MPVRRYRLPTAPRRTFRTWKIIRSDGKFLRDASEPPFSWSERDMVALSFRTKKAAETFVNRHFLSCAVARENGIRVVG